MQVSQEQYDKIMFLIKKGREEGAKLEVGGERYGVLACITSLVMIVLLDQRSRRPQQLLLSIDFWHPVISSMKHCSL